MEKQIIELIANVLKLIHYSEEKHKINALDSISKLAKTMHVTLKAKKINMDINLALIMFIDADKPIDLTLNNLYNLIK